MNGFKKQWGKAGTSSETSFTFTFPIPFSDTNYLPLLSQERAEAGEHTANFYIISKNKANMTIRSQRNYMYYECEGY